MRNTTFLLLLFFHFTLFAQQTLKIEINTGQSIIIYLVATGDNSNNDCNQCNNALTSEMFNIMPGSYSYNLLSDIPGNWTSNLPFCQPCTPQNVDLFCGHPIWQMIGFSSPGSSSCCAGRVGETSCSGANDFFQENNFTASWTYFPLDNTILVEFN